MVHKIHMMNTDIYTSFDKHPHRAKKIHGAYHIRKPCHKATQGLEVVYHSF
jgi:hypothetical protein